MNAAERKLDALMAQDRFVRGLARSLLRRNDLAEDVVQGTWAVALASGPREPGALRSWLGGIVRNLAFKTLRGEMRRRRREEASGRPEGLPSAAEILERESYRQEIVRAVLDLEEPCRSAIILRYLEELSPRVVARRLGVPVETARTRIKRGLELLRRKLGSGPGRGFLGSWLLAAATLRPGGGPVEALAAALNPVAGVLVMGMKAKVAISAAVLAAASLFVWTTLPESAPSRAPEEAGSVLDAAARVAEERPTPDGPPPPEPASPVAASATEAPLADAAAAATPPAPPAAGEPDPYGALEVRVVWATDKTPATNVLVRVLPFGSPDPFFNEVLEATDSAGRIRIDRIHAGTAAIFSVFGGDVRTKVSAGATAAATLEIPLGATIEGRVVDGGDRPVGGAGVVLCDEGGHTEGPVVTVTGPDGAFRLRDVECKAWRNIGARAPGFAPSPVTMVSANPGGKVTLRLVLGGPGGELKGLVVDPLGGPVAGAYVKIGKATHTQWALPDGTRVCTPGPVTVRTGEDGRFHAVGLAPGEAPVEARARTWAPWTGTATVSEAAGPELRIALVEGFTLRGKVTDPAGAPVPRVAVQVNGYGNLTSSYVRTKADGSYRILGLAPGEAKVTFESDGHGQLDLTVHGASGQEVTRDVVLKAGGTIRGRLLDRDGLPLEKWIVALEHMADGKFDHKWLTTDAEGRFEGKDCLDVAYTVGVKAPGEKGIPLRQKMKARPDAGEVVIRLTEDLRPTCYIQGSVVAPDGEPVGGAQLSCFREGQGGAPIELSQERTGAFTFGPMPPGVYTLNVDAKGHPVWRSEKHELKVEETWDLGAIVLEAPGHLVVTLKRKPGAPEGAPRIRVSEGGRGGSDVLPVEGDTARSRALATGDYWVRVAGDGFLSQDLATVIRAGETTRMEITLEGGIAVTIQLLDPAGPGAARSAQVRVLRGTEVLLQPEAYRSGDSGLRCVAGLRPGTYTVEAQADNGRRASGTLVVADGSGKTTLDLPLR